MGRTLRGSSQLFGANQLGRVRPCAMNALVSAVRQGIVLPIGGTADAMPQGGGTCLTCDGNGHRQPAGAASEARFRHRANSYNTRLSEVTQRPMKLTTPSSGDPPQDLSVD